MTLKEKVIATAHTGINFCGAPGEWDELEKYIECIMGRPVQTIEMADWDFWENMHELTKLDFKKMLNGEYREETK